MISSVTNTEIISLYTLILVCCCCYCISAKDNITTGEFINDGPNYLESPGKKFQMGFFPHGKTAEVRRYVGIWYTMDPKTVVWVANRDKPVLDSTGILTVSEDGSAKLLNGKQDVYFSTDPADGASSTALKLLDNGNAVLINVVTGSILWQSFRTPTDTFLPGMKMVDNLKLTSWKSPEDPGSGSFEFQQDPGTNRYFILEESTTLRWKSGNMSTKSFDKNQIFSQAFLLLSNTTTQTRKIIRCYTYSSCREGGRIEYNESYQSPKITVACIKCVAHLGFAAKIRSQSCVVAYLDLNLLIHPMIIVLDARERLKSVAQELMTDS
ncbi:unnamed protein product [Lactuca virosa]|uniref:Bulb-type lectin domain-containing protein n=1 Tax=Lactuca virosa TaxID=75947 RepID=A0AAU9MQV0_9ASTR|nr:unnamed protein product [Lactuca virosa]